jgi:hypothetical protein
MNADMISRAAKARSTLIGVHLRVSAFICGFLSSL